MAAEPEGSFWKLQDGLIQSQAGKPFSHEKGPRIKFPDDEIVDNRCLCKYRYMRYFAFYQRVDKKLTSKVPFLQPVPFYSQAQQEWVEMGYTVELRPGYVWESHAGPIYLGCHPAGTFQLGVWKDVNLPYNAVVTNKTSPTPYYIQQTQDQNNPSLQCMIVCSYKCCNGQDGCGIPLDPQGSDSFEDSFFPMCVQDFYVTNIGQAVLNNNYDLAVVTPIQGTQQCGVHRYKKMQIIHNCDSMTLRVSQAFTVPGKEEAQEVSALCPSCFDSLPVLARSTACDLFSHLEFVLWTLWKFDLGDCDPCKKDNQIIFPGMVTDFSGVPASIVGKGPGCLLRKEHDTDRHDFCSLNGPGVSYQWTFVPYLLGQNQDGYVPPEPLLQNPCKDYCQKVKDPGTISDSLSFSGAVPPDQLPCNIPDPSRKSYQLFTFQYFNIWYLKTQKAQGTEGLPVDPCFATYKISPQSLNNGKLNWKKEQDGDTVTDFQIQSAGYLRAYDFLSFRKDRKDKVYIVLPIDEDPPEDPSDSKLKKFNITEGQLDQFFLQDTSQNLCRHIYQVYMMGCRCKEDPCKETDCKEGLQPSVKGSTCSKWTYIGRRSEQQLIARHICLQNWQVSTVQNTFSTQDAGPIGIFVYTVMTDQAKYCADPPKAPNSNVYYAIERIKPVCAPDSAGWDQSTSWTFQIRTADYCTAQEQDAAIIQGFKGTSRLSDSQLLMVYNHTVYPGDLCQIYYITRVGAYPNVYNEYCQTLQPSQNWTAQNDPLQDNTIAWKLGQCIGYKRFLKWKILMCTPTESNSSGIPSDSLSKWQDGQKTFSYDSDSSSQWHWGWLSDPDPRTGTALSVSGGIVTPVVYTDNGRQELCTVYYVVKVHDYQGCQDIQKYNTEEPQTNIRQTYTIEWNLKKCLYYKYYIIYYYAVFRAECIEANARVQWGVIQSDAVQWVKAPVRAIDPLPDENTPDEAGIVSNPNSTIWQRISGGWKNQPDPLSGHTLPSMPPPANIVYPHWRQKQSDSWSQYCTISYVNLIWAYYGTEKGAEVLAQSTGLPITNLAGTYIDWNPEQCFPDYAQYVCYNVASFTPTCQLPSGISSDSIEWQTLVVPVRRGETITQGWADSANIKEAKSLPSAGFYVSPGKLCTIYYINIKGKAVFCSPSAADPNSPVWGNGQTPDAIVKNYSILWNLNKCLPDYRRKISYYLAKVMPTCDSDNIVQWQTPQVITTLGDSDVAPPYGWYDANNKNTVAVANGIVEPGSNCVLYYRQSYCDSVTCSNVKPTTNDPGNGRTQQLEKASILWATSCRDPKTYVYYAYFTSSKTCKDPNPFYTIHYAEEKKAEYDPGLLNLYKNGWYNGKETAFAGKTPLPVTNNTVSLADCKGTYMWVYKSGYACEYPSDSSPEAPSQIPQPIFPDNCISKTTYLKWCAVQVKPDCEHPGGRMGTVQTPGYNPTLTTQDCPTGYYTGDTPTPGTRITDLTQILPDCSIYYIKTQDAQDCEVDPDTMSCSFSFSEFNLRWPEHCTDTTRYITWVTAEVTPQCGAPDNVVWGEPTTTSFTAQDVDFSTSYSGFGWNTQANPKNAYDPQKLSFVYGNPTVTGQCNLYYIHSMADSTTCAVYEPPTAYEAPSLSRVNWPPNCFDTRTILVAARYYFFGVDCATGGWKYVSNTSSQFTYNDGYATPNETDIFKTNGGLYGAGQTAAVPSYFKVQVPSCQFIQPEFRTKFTCSKSDSYPDIPPLNSAVVNTSGVGIDWPSDCLSWKTLVAARYYFFGVDCATGGWKYVSNTSSQFTYNTDNPNATKLFTNSLYGAGQANPVPPQFNVNVPSCQFINADFNKKFTCCESDSYPDIPPLNDAVVNTSGVGIDWPSGCLSWKTLVAARCYYFKPDCSNSQGWVYASNATTTFSVAGQSAAYYAGLSGSVYYATIDKFTKPNCRFIQLAIQAKQTRCESDSYPAIPNEDPNIVNGKGTYSGWTKQCQEIKRYITYVSIPFTYSCINGTSSVTQGTPTTRTSSFAYDDPKYNNYTPVSGWSLYPGVVITSYGTSQYISGSTIYGKNTAYYITYADVKGCSAKDPEIPQNLNPIFDVGKDCSSGGGTDTKYYQAYCYTYASCNSVGGTDFRAPVSTCVSATQSFSITAGWYAGPNPLEDTKLGTVAVDCYAYYISPLGIGATTTPCPSGGECTTPTAAITWPEGCCVYDTYCVLYTEYHWDADDGWKLYNSYQEQDNPQQLKALLPTVKFELNLQQIYSEDGQKAFTIILLKAGPCE